MLSNDNETKHLKELRKDGCERMDAEVSLSNDSQIWTDFLWNKMKLKGQK